LQSIVTGSRSLRLIRCGPPVKLSYTLNQASILRARSVKIEFGFALFGTAGTTPLGAKGSGTLFSLSQDGQLTTLYSFNARSGSDSSDPMTPLIQATSGSLYGTTERGAIGSSIDGTVFSLNLGLGPFVALQTISGQVGERVTILGTDLTDASSVTFNGTPATFTVNSTGSAITATVPAGATTGTVEVTTPSGTLDSNKPFHVIS
jgi:uncharacterized repeat protein (TIGR03803 family)